MDIIATAVADVARSKLGLVSQKAPSGPRASAGGPQEHLVDAWSEHRKARAATAEGAQSAGHAMVLARLTATLDLQERHLRLLGTTLRQPHAAAPTLPMQRHLGEVPDPLVRAHAHIDQAEDAIDRVEEAGALPRRLSTWPIPVRNGVVYFITALVLSAPVGWLITAGAVNGRFELGTVALLAIPCCGLPILAYGTGMLIIGVLFRPWLGGPVPRSPIVGLVTSFLVTSLTSITVAIAAW